MALYGDPAYPLRVYLQVPYRGVGITPQMELYNKAMSSVRMSVEWLFGDIVNYFKFLDFKKNLKISLSAVGKMYIVAAILRNALTCMYGNLTSEYFSLDPPTIHDYFAWSETQNVFNQVYLNQKVWAWSWYNMENLTINKNKCTIQKHETYAWKVHYCRM